MERTRPDRDWQAHSACRPDRLAAADISPDIFFPYLETAAILANLRERFCNLCPVTSQCLDQAQAIQASGIWAGMTTAERRAMGRRRTRVKCPVCSAGEPATVDGVQVCAACGSSWEPDRPRRSKSATKEAA